MGAAGAKPPKTLVGGKAGKLKVIIRAIQMNDFLSKHWKQVETIVDNALAEDAAHNDITTKALITNDQQGKATLITKDNGILAGISVATLVFNRVDSTVKVKELANDGTRLNNGDALAVIEGAIASILRSERVALNLLQRLCGISTETARYVEAVSGTRAIITDTRKTTPGLRLLEKYAVSIGGGKNHRLNLSDAVLIKDNHLMALRARGLGLGEAVKRARENIADGLKIEVEVESIGEAKEALLAKADIIMVDNMSNEDMRQVVELSNGKALIEASGGITLSNVRAVAETGVDIISIGALTHSVRSLDISLDLEV